MFQEKINYLYLCVLLVSIIEIRQIPVVMANETVATGKKNNLKYQNLNLLQYLKKTWNIDY